MYNTHGERRSISIRRQKVCVDSKLVISCRMTHNLIKIYKMWFKSYKHFHKLQMYARTDSHRDNSAHLWVVEFFFFHCAAHQDVINENSIEITIFQFTETIYDEVNKILLLLGSSVSVRPSSVFLMRLETDVLSLYDLSCWCEGNHEHRNHSHASFMCVGTCRAILKSFLYNTYDNAM